MPLLYGPLQLFIDVTALLLRVPFLFVNVLQQQLAMHAAFTTALQWLRYISKTDWVSPPKVEGKNNLLLPRQKIQAPFMPLHEADSFSVAQLLDAPLVCPERTGAAPSFFGGSAALPRWLLLVRRFAAAV